MSNAFAVTFLRMAMDVTGAECGMALDSEKSVLALANLTNDDIEADGFAGFANVAQAYEFNERPHITNNMILDPEAAPDTNTNFAALRVVIVFPLDEHGAVYIDQHISRGVIAKTDAEKLMQVADRAIASDMLGADEATLRDLYDSL
ncbi:MAG: hypothetical protein AAFV33_17950 [Chloroflexota bacterium]